jgi:hypothetical protein
VELFNHFVCCSYILPVHVVNKQELAWAGCFMGSIGRIDDNRMYVVKKGEAKKYMRRPMNVAERERMMGFTKGYVEQPGKMRLIVSMLIMSFLIIVLHGVRTQSKLSLKLY